MVFFTGNGTPSSAASLKQPYLIGFSHSRPDEKDVFTEGPWRQSRHRGYQEPKYANGQTAFLPAYDCYSLGLILLEIGLWKPLGDLTKKSATSQPENIRQYLLEHCVPILGYSMGYYYRDAVQICLSGSFSDIDRAQNGSSQAISNRDIYLSFKHLVIGKLMHCIA